MNDVAVLASIIHAEEGTDLRTYVAELLVIARAWDAETLHDACQFIDRDPAIDPHGVGLWAFSSELQHRLHDRPAPSYDLFLRAGISPF